MVTSSTVFQCLMHFRSKSWMSVYLCACVGLICQRNWAGYGDPLTSSSILDAWMCPFLGRAGQSGAPASLAFKAGRACFHGESIHSSCSRLRTIALLILYRGMMLIDSDLGFAMISVKLLVDTGADIWKDSWSSDIGAKPKRVRVGRFHASAHRAITVMTQAHNQLSAPIR